MKTFDQPAFAGGALDFVYYVARAVVYTGAPA